MGIFSIDEQIVDFSGTEIYNMLSKYQLDEIVELYKLRNIKDYEILSQLNIDIKEFDPTKVYYINLPNKMIIRLEDYHSFAQKILEVFHAYGIRVIIGPEGLTAEELKEVDKAHLL